MNKNKIILLLSMTTALFSSTAGVNMIMDNNKISTLERQCEIYKEDSDTMILNIEELKKEVNNLKSEISEKDNDIKSKDDIINNREEKIKEQENEISKLQEENKELVRQVKLKEENEKENIVTGNKNGKEISVELTGYCTCSKCSGGWGNQTAMGTQTTKGVIAAPKSIPLGSKLYIPELTWYKSDGIFSVEDRGSAVIEKNGVYVIDVFFDNHDEAIKFGRVKTKAYLM